MLWVPGHKCTVGTGEKVFIFIFVCFFVCFILVPKLQYNHFDEMFPFILITFFFFFKGMLIVTLSLTKRLKIFLVFRVFTSTVVAVIIALILVAVLS